LLSKNKIRPPHSEEGYTVTVTPFLHKPARNDRKCSPTTEFPLSPKKLKLSTQRAFFTPARLCFQKQESVSVFHLTWLFWWDRVLVQRHWDKCVPDFSRTKFDVSTGSIVSGRFGCKYTHLRFCTLQTLPETIDLACQKRSISPNVHRRI